MKTKRILGLCLGLGFLSLAVSCKSDPEFTIKFVDHDQTVLQTLTLKESAVNAAFTTEEWAALEATKPNWTITLV